MNNQTSKNSVYDSSIRLFILFLIVAWCLLILYPFASIILWSFILALALYPLHKSLSDKMGGRKKLASFLIVFSFLLIVILPSGLLVSSLVEEVKELKASYDNGALSIPPPTETVKEWPLIGEKIYDTWEAASVNLKQLIVTHKDQLTKTVSNLSKGILGAASAVFQILISFIIAGIFLVIGGAGESVRKFMRKVAGNRGDEFADITMKTVGSVVKGVIGVALILALLHGILFILAGVPYAGIWTLLVFVLCVVQIPAIFVTLPIIVYLFANMEITPAIIYTVLLVIAGLSDNILKPILLGKGAPVPMLVIFLGVIGGFIFSGFIGLFTGAIVMSIGYTLFTGWINSTDTPETEIISE